MVGPGEVGFDQGAACALTAIPAGRPSIGVAGAGPVSDRAVGVDPTGSNRYILLRLRNDSSNSITSFTLRYDGEQWRIALSGAVTVPTVMAMFYTPDAG